MPIRRAHSSRAHSSLCREPSWGNSHAARVGEVVVLRLVLVRALVAVVAVVALAAVVLAVVAALVVVLVVEVVVVVIVAGVIDDDDTVR